MVRRVIPSMAGFGGWGGFLGLRAAQPVNPDRAVSLDELRKRVQLFPDTWMLDHASFVRGDDFKELPPLLKRNDDKPLIGKVALIGGGIANLIAAYELSRNGVEVTLFDDHVPEQNRVDKPFGGRLASDVQNKFQADLGAAAFPSRAPLFWHYVWRVALANGLQPPAVVESSPLQSPGVRATKVCYQNTWFDFSPDLTRLPPIVQEAAFLFRDWLLWLNDGTAEPNTVFLKDAMSYARTPRPSLSLFSFWQEMRRRYDRRSFESVLADEVFARGSDPEALLSAFASVGLGTGGFGAVYDIACLEILRNVLWDCEASFQLPAKMKPGADDDQADSAAATDDAGVVGGYDLRLFANDLAVAAFIESRAFFPQRKMEEMFVFGRPVAGLCVAANNQTRVCFDDDDDDPNPFDLTIVAISSRAMEAMGLAQDGVDNPFTIEGEHTPTSLKAVESVQAGIHQLNMVSGYKLFARVPNPLLNRDWPLTDDKAKIISFVTDRFPGITTVPGNGYETDTMAVAAEVYGADALKLQAADKMSRLELVASAFAPQGTDPWPYKEVRTRIVSSPDTREKDWTRQSGANGAFKLDRPDDDYFAASLMYQSQLVLQPESEKRTWGRTFLAGDSVGHTGGTVEGAARSALMATTAALYQIRKMNPKIRNNPLRSEPLLSPAMASFHSWRSVNSQIEPLPKWKSMTARGRCVFDPAYPPTWRPEAGDGMDEHMQALTVAPAGDWMACISYGKPMVRGFNATRGTWSSWVATGEPEPLARLAIASGPGPAYLTVSMGYLVGLGLDDTHHRVWLADVTDQFKTWRLMGWPSANGIAAAVVGPGLPEVAPLHLVLTRAAYNDRLYYGVQESDGDFRDFVTVMDWNQDYVQAARSFALDGHVGSGHATLVIADSKGAIRATARKPDGQFTVWVDIPPPKEGLTASRLTVCPAGNATRVVALFSDGRLYECRVRAFGVQLVTNWTVLPYPAALGYDTSELAMGMSVVPGDRDGYSTLWLASTPTTHQ